MGQGSTFRVYLPATEALAAEPEQTDLAASTGRGNESMLVVEDNDAVRGFVTQTLRDAGYRVTDAEQALVGAGDASTAADAAFDLLLTDIVLPEMDGYELARQASAARPALRVLYMSGYADNPKLREDALRTASTCWRSLSGPVSWRTRLRRVLDRSLGVR